MQGILQDFRKKIKRALRDDHFYMTCLMIAVGIMAFELGRFSMTSEQQESSTLVFEAYPKEVLQEAIAEKGIAARTAAEETELPYMGAKTGRVYYPAACTSAQKIKKENRLYFATILEAEAAGRTRSSQCK